MSEAKGQQHEPSMEEILASIRRIIAEDGETTAPPGAAPIAAPQAGGRPVEKPAFESSEDEILELTEVVEPDGSVVSLGVAGPVAKAIAAEPEPAQQMDEMLPKAPEPAAPTPPQATVPAEADGIVSPATAAASVAALSQIAALSSREERAQRDIPLGAGHLTLEALVREELRPILKDWLDRHLPEMVERLVKAEIARLVHDVQRR